MGLSDRISRGQHVQPGDSTGEVQQKQTGSTDWNEVDMAAARQANASSEQPIPDDIKELLARQDGGTLNADERRKLVEWQMDQQISRQGRG